MRRQTSPQTEGTCHFLTRYSPYASIYLLTLYVSSHSQAGNLLTPTPKQQEQQQEQQEQQEQQQQQQCHPTSSIEFCVFFLQEGGKALLNAIKIATIFASPILELERHPRKL